MDAIAACVTLGAIRQHANPFGAERIWFAIQKIQILLTNEERWVVDRIGSRGVTRVVQFRAGKASPKIAYACIPYPSGYQDPAIVEKRSRMQFSACIHVGNGAESACGRVEYLGACCGTSKEASTVAAVFGLAAGD